MASSSNSPCAACKFLRRKCTVECVFAPYFPPDQPHKFANVHKIFGASNVTKLLNELHPTQREDAVNSLAYEAEARVKDPVYGCVGAISILQHQVKQLQAELQCARAELAKYISAGMALPSPSPSPSPSQSPLGIGVQLGSGPPRDHIFRDHPQIMQAEPQPQAQAQPPGQAQAQQISRDHILRSNANYVEQSDIVRISGAGHYQEAHMAASASPNYLPMAVPSGSVSVAMVTHYSSAAAARSGSPPDERVCISSPYSLHPAKRED